MATITVPPTTTVTTTPTIPTATAEELAQDEKDLLARADNGQWYRRRGARALVIVAFVLSVISFLMLIVIWALWGTNQTNNNNNSNNGNTPTETPPNYWSGIGTGLVATTTATTNPDRYGIKTSFGEPSLNGAFTVEEIQNWLQTQNGVTLMYPKIPCLPNSVDDSSNCASGSIPYFLWNTSPPLTPPDNNSDWQSRQFSPAVVRTTSSTVSSTRSSDIQGSWDLRNLLHATFGMTVNSVPDSETVQ